MQHNTMYTLGQVVRCLWPDYGSDKPLHIIDKLLVAPLTGLGMLQQRREWKAADPDELGELVNRLPADLADPPGGVCTEDQAPFWFGYYHYRGAIEAAEQYGHDELRAVGEALWGQQWQTDMARALGLSDARRVRQWLAGERRIPAGIWSDLAGHLRHRQRSIDEVLRHITGQRVH